MKTGEPPWETTSDADVCTLVWTDLRRDTHAAVSQRASVFFSTRIHVDGHVSAGRKRPGTRTKGHPWKPASNCSHGSLSLQLYISAYTPFSYTDLSGGNSRAHGPSSISHSEERPGAVITETNVTTVFNLPRIGFVAAVRACCCQANNALRGLLWCNGCQP